MADFKHQQTTGVQNLHVGSRDNNISSSKMAKWDYRVHIYTFDITAHLFVMISKHHYSAVRS